MFVLYQAARALELVTLFTMMDSMLTYIVLTIVVVFQNDKRGDRRFLSGDRRSRAGAGLSPQRPRALVEADEPTTSTKNNAKKPAAGRRHVGLTCVWSGDCPMEKRRVGRSDGLRARARVGSRGTRDRMNMSRALAVGAWAVLVAATLSAGCNTPTSICGDHRDAFNAAYARCDIPVVLPTDWLAWASGPCDGMPASCEDVTKLSDPGKILNECIPTLETIDCDTLRADPRGPSICRAAGYTFEGSAASRCAP